MAKQHKNGMTSSKPGSDSMFYLFSGFLILVLPLIRLQTAQDTALMPRLLAVAVFLFIISVVFIIRKLNGIEGLPILKNPVFLLLAMYWVMVIVSVIFAFNHKEGYFDIVRTFIFITLVFNWFRFFSVTSGWLLYRFFK